MAPRARMSRGPKRKTLWLQFEPLDTTLSAATSAAILFSLNAAALALRPFTIVRSHFEILLRSDQGAAVEQQNGGFGLAVVSDEAVAVGVTAVPTPISQLGSSLWFLHQLYMAQESHVTDVAQPAGVYSIDSKAMRKVEVGQDIIVVAENSAIGLGCTLAAGGRILIKTN